jgi:regulator of sigma E protease
VTSVDSQLTIARDAGLQAKDVIVAVDDIKTFAPLDPQTLTNQLKSHAGQPVVLHVHRKGASVDVTVVPNADGRIGIGIGATQDISWRPMTLVESATRSVTVTGQGLYGITYAIAGMVHLVEPTPGAEPHSIVAIFQVGADAWQAGMLQFITILFSLSINLAVFNLLPFPMLDGGYVVFYTIEAVRGKPLSTELQNKLKSTFLLLLLALFIFGLYNDFAHPINK